MMTIPYIRIQKSIIISKKIIYQKII
jgi:hypothetical protein